ncbi:MAG TPA: hypothetical protein PK263_03115, partial [bacterium]|nr:hypothetical protein [bacterium]
RIAEKDGVKVKTFQVIYELIDFAKAELSEMLPALIIEDELGTGVVLAIFHDDKKGFVGGGKLESGHAKIGDEIKFFQNNNEKYRSKITTLRREKSEVKEVASGTEFGFGIAAGAKVAVGDTFTIFKTRSEKREV